MENISETDEDIQNRTIIWFIEISPIFDEKKFHVLWYSNNPDLDV